MVKYTINLTGDQVKFATACWADDFTWADVAHNLSLPGNESLQGLTRHDYRMICRVENERFNAWCECHHGGQVNISMNKAQLNESEATDWGW